MSNLNAPWLHNEKAAIARLEAILWPDGPVCPRCGGRERITKVRGATARLGLWRCGPCRRQFTVTVGTVFERSHVKMHLWFQAVYLMAASRKGFSAHQLHRTLGVTYKTAWFMAHRVREAMQTGALAPLGGAGKIIEADETFIGHDHSKKRRRGFAHKFAVLTLIDQHCSEKHLHRYLAEFDFRYNARAALGVDDERRTIRALAGIVGKRLMYRDSSAWSRFQ
jgi:transposase-like protein